MSVAERVDTGIKELDTHVPDWRTRIDSATLDMKLHGYCILGQLYGSFNTGTRTLDLWDDTVIVYGFEASGPDYTDAEYRDLTDEWKRRLTGDNADA